MARPTGLGKGLDALFPSDIVASEVAAGKGGVTEVSIADVTPMQGQPRTMFDEDKIEQLSYSIKEHGILQPLLLQQEANGKFTIIAGERRYRAAKKAGLHTLPAVIRTASELNQLEMALIENMQREDLHPLDQALSIKRLREDFSQDMKTIAKRLGKAESTLSNMMRLLNLPKAYQDSLRSNVISEGHARTLLALEGNPEAQKTLYNNIVTKHWSVRAAELFVQSYKAEGPNKATISQKMSPTNEVTKALEKRLGRSVRIARTAKGGKVTIAFTDDEDLQKLYQQLS